MVYPRVAAGLLAAKYFQNNNNSSQNRSTIPVSGGEQSSFAARRNPMSLEETLMRQQFQMIQEEQFRQREHDIRQRRNALVGGFRSLVTGGAGGAGFRRGVTTSVTKRNS